VARGKALGAREVEEHLCGVRRGDARAAAGCEALADAQGDLNVVPRILPASCATARAVRQLLQEMRQSEARAEGAARLGAAYKRAQRACSIRYSVEPVLDMSRMMRCRRAAVANQLEDGEYGGWSFPPFSARRFGSGSQVKNERVITSAPSAPSRAAPLTGAGRARVRSEMMPSTTPRPRWRPRAPILSGDQASTASAHRIGRGRIVATARTCCADRLKTHVKALASFRGRPACRRPIGRSSADIERV